MRGERKGSPFFIYLHLLAEGGFHVGMKIKFSDLLTFLSLKTSGKITRAIFTWVDDKGEIVFENGEMREIDFRGMEEDEALTFLQDRRIVVEKFDDVMHLNSPEVLKELLMNFLTDEENEGFVICDDRENELSQELPEAFNPLYEKVKSKAFKELERKRIGIFQQDTYAIKVLAARIKPDLNLIFLFRRDTEEEIDKLLLYLLKKVLRITSLCH